MDERKAIDFDEKHGFLSFVHHLKQHHVLHNLDECSRNCHDWHYHFYASADIP